MERKMKIKNIRGIQKELFILHLKFHVFFHYLPSWFSGKIGLSKFILLLRRLLYFISKLKHNKFVRWNGQTRLDLYIPGFPTKGFFTACDKFTVFGQKLPSATVLMSVTSGCRFKCQHCYQRLDKGKDIEINFLKDAANMLQNMGVAFFNIEGGDPFLVYKRLEALCESIDNRSEIWVNSTGDGMTLERLLRLKERNVTAIMFSMHSPDPQTLNKFMGSGEAWGTMEKGVSLCHQAGIAVAFNVCLLKEDFQNGVLQKIIEKAKEFGAVMVQLIHPKSSGAWLETSTNTFSKDDLDSIKKLVNLYNSSYAYRNYPSISAQVIEESPEVFGCTAGGTDRFYINAKGDVQPCEFLNISFGNIETEPLPAIYQRMRAEFECPGEDWLCQKYNADVIKAYHSNNLSVLPLDKSISKKICSGWHRGNPTRLYEVLEKRLVEKK